MEQSSSLTFGGLTTAELLSRHPAPLYVYDAAVIERQIGRVKQVLPEFQPFYSLKANPNKAITRLLLQAGCGMEIASGGELYLCKQLGADPRDIVFAGPGKTDDELEFAIREQIFAINAESVHEIARIDAIARRLGLTANIQIRVNTSQGVDDSPEMMTGVASQFGIAEELLEESLEGLTLRSSRIVGVHVYTASQLLKASDVIGNFGRACDIFNKVRPWMADGIHALDFGGGFGVPYQADEPELDLDAVRLGIRKIFHEKLAGDATIRLILELGRFLIAESGTYLTRVIDIKQSRGQTFVVVEGGIHQFLRPKFMGLNHPTVAAEKLDTDRQQVVTIVGQTCTPLDVLAKNVFMPALEIGDVIAIQKVGAYGYTMSMMNFLSHPWPAEILVHGDEATVIRPAGSYADLFDY